MVDQRQLSSYLPDEQTRLGMFYPVSIACACFPSLKTTSYFPTGPEQCILTIWISFE